MNETHHEKRLIGYARVSTYGQTLDSQLEQLRAAEIQNAFNDEAGILLTGVSKPENVTDDAPVIIAVSSHP